MKSQGLLFVPLTRAKLWSLMKTHGMQMDLFNREILSFQWDGLEYQFYLDRDRLCLENVVVRMDITLGPVRDWKAYGLTCS